MSPDTKKSTQSDFNGSNKKLGTRGQLLIFMKRVQFQKFRAVYEAER